MSAAWMPHGNDDGTFDRNPKCKRGQVLAPSLTRRVTAHFSRSRLRHRRRLVRLRDHPTPPEPIGEESIRDRRNWAQTGDLWRRDRADVRQRRCPLRRKEREKDVRNHLPGTGPPGALHKWLGTLFSRASLTVARVDCRPRFGRAGANLRRSDSGGSPTCSSRRTWWWFAEAEM